MGYLSLVRAHSKYGPTSIARDLRDSKNEASMTDRALATSPQGIAE
jgi:hypothetical protein